MRPAELANDAAGKVDAIRHAFNTCEEMFHEKYDVVVDLDITNPIKTSIELVEVFFFQKGFKFFLLFWTEMRKIHLFLLI